MIKIIERIENFLSYLILRGYRLMKGLILSITPQKIKNKIYKWRLALTQLKANLILFLKNSPQKIKNTLHVLVDHFKKSKEKYFFNYMKKTKESFLNLKKSHPDQKVFIVIFHLLKNRLTTRVLSFNKKEVALFTFSFIIVLVSSVLVYNSSKHIVHEYLISKRPASEGAIPYDRPWYYKKERLNAQVTHLRLPVFFSNINQLKTIDLDFNVRASNRFCKKYIQNKEIQLKDYLINSLEPVLPQLPLDDEGKNIIREKIKEDVLSFLKFHNIECDIQDISLIYILAN